jgi:hypothetical protein
MPPERTIRRDAGAKLITFETQSRTDRAWRTIGVFDDRLLAVAEAERALEGNRTPAVRVVQVLYDPNSTKCTEYTIFRATCFDEENERARKRVPDQEMFEWGADGRDRDGDFEPAWIERHWPVWGPDWATTALALSFAVLIASVLFRWAR